MSTVRTTICRHIDITDIVLMSQDPHDPKILIQQRASTEAELVGFLNQVRVGKGEDWGDDHPNLVRCDETGEVVEISWGNRFSTQIFQTCDRHHWRLVHQVIETGQEVHA